MTQPTLVLLDRATLGEVALDPIAALGRLVCHDLSLIHI